MERASGRNPVKTPSAEELAAATVAVVVAGAMAAHPDAGVLIAGVAAVVPTLAGKLADLIARYTGQNDKALLRAYEESARDWVLRWTTEVPRVIEAQRVLAERVDEFDARLAERIDDHEFPTGARQLWARGDSRGYR
jgi:hypothetical protein